LKYKLSFLLNNCNYEDLPVEMYNHAVLLEVAGPFETSVFICRIALRRIPEDKPSSSLQTNPVPQATQLHKNAKCFYKSLTLQVRICKFLPNIVHCGGNSF